MNQINSKKNNPLELFLKEIGENPNRDEICQKRIMNGYKEALDGYKEIDFNITKFNNQTNYDEIVLLQGIPMISFCEHHMLPITGKIHFGYMPDKFIIGLSKIPRIVNHVCRKMSLQEKIASNIAEIFHKHIQDLGVAMQVSAKHMCMSVRGIKTDCIDVKTCYFDGVFKNNNTMQNKFFKMLEL